MQGLLTGSRCKGQGTGFGGGGEPETQPRRGPPLAVCSLSEPGPSPDSLQRGAFALWGPQQITIAWETQNNRNGFSRFRRPDVQNQGVNRAALLPKAGGRALQASPPASGGRGPPWHSLAWRRSTPTSASGFLRPSLGVCVPRLIRTPVAGPEPTLLPYDLILTWSHRQRPCFLIRSHSEVPGLGRRPMLVEDTGQPPREGRAPLPGGCGPLPGPGRGSRTCSARSAPPAAA